jgi:hypothetical protein
LYRSDFTYSWYERISASSDYETYTFTVDQSSTYYVAVDFYNRRMYAPNCRWWGMTTASVTLRKDGEYLQGGYSLQTDYYYYGF